MPSKPEYKLSIVIAMYNIENYIRYCLESCVHQEGVNEGDYEIIIVNDGSTDGSLAIAEEYAKGRDYITIISQNNAGLSAARNAGMKQAQGDYIWFVDGDDAIAPNAISILLSHVGRYGADAYICNFNVIDQSGVVQDTSHFKVYPLMSGKNIHDKYMSLLPMMAWLTIYKTDALRVHGLTFLPGILHEDKEFSVRAHHCMESISFIKDAIYNYRAARCESIMSKAKKDNTKSLASEITIIDSFEDFFRNEDTAFCRKLLGMCASTFLIRRYDAAFVDNDVTKKLLKDNKKRLYTLMWKSGQLKQRALVLFIILMPNSVLKRTLPRIGDRSKLL